MVRIFIFIICILLASCVSLQWKYNYVGTRMESFRKYDNDSDTSIVLMIPSDFTHKRRLKKQSKKKIIKMMDKLEKGSALYPDSVSVNDKKLDSFYFNKYKIEYIKDHKLVSKNIFFIEN